MVSFSCEVRPFLARVPVISPKMRQRPLWCTPHPLPSPLPTHLAPLHASGPDITSDTPSHTISTMLRSSLSLPSPLIPWPTLPPPIPFTYSSSPLSLWKLQNQSCRPRVLLLHSFNYSLRPKTDLLTRRYRIVVTSSPRRSSTLTATVATAPPLPALIAWFTSPESNTDNIRYVSTTSARVAVGRLPRPDCDAAPIPICRSC